MIRRALLAPLRASTYRRAVFLLLGAVILLPYVLLAGLVGRTVLISTDDRVATLAIAVVVSLIGLVPPFLSGTRELEIAAVRALLRVDLPHPGPPAMETRLRAALWFAVHLAVGAMIGTALVGAVPLAFMGLSARVTPASAGAALLLLLGTVYATAGLGALAATMAPVLLGPSPAERLAAVEAREHRLAERNRLARELHDSVGHALTATTLQAGAARAVFDKDPEFARRALEAIEEVGRSAMDDLDHVLGMLRDENERSFSSPASGDLDRLLDDVRAGGIEVHADVELPGTLPAGTLPAEAFRLVQESLTNAAKHGSGAIHLRIRSGDGIEIEVRNPFDGRPAGRSGRGLTGMRERVRLAGGTIEAGPEDGEAGPEGGEVRRTGGEAGRAGGDAGRAGDSRAGRDCAEWRVRARLPRDLRTDR
ncbi:histidine kinase [Actinoplanes sp. NBRC 103695]|uniref:sensor histidine kinase n=1 Tax=Actinoplanes sp. NBRC 103695 TaxID=3032202 RepID=UPI0024A276BD|nr:histidine kinase [Actinoplanes sp. NBRC 103695]GLZ00556.1 two-component sensor histidine kinase [Actinoplanes sp. NBRC 103695]